MRASSHTKRAIRNHRADLSILVTLLSLPLLAFPLLAQEFSTLTLQQSTNLQDWTNIEITPDIITANGTLQLPNESPERFFRLELSLNEVITPSMVHIPGGSFTMGNSVSEDTLSDAPPVTVNVSDFFMAKHEVTTALWRSVRTWGLAHGYSDLGAGAFKGAEYPIHSITWYDMVKWCNALSEMQGLTPVYSVNDEVMKTGTSVPTAEWSANGYRLPTEAEWEKAARGGVTDKRFVWGDIIVHYLANYSSHVSRTYDVSPTRGTHPTYLTPFQPFSSPVGSFPANSFGLFDMAGNSWEFCWDRYGAASYQDGATDPRGAESGTGRVLRGGSWKDRADTCRLAFRFAASPTVTDNSLGFRVARSVSP